MLQVSGSAHYWASKKKGKMLREHFHCSSVASSEPPTPQKQREKSRQRCNLGEQFLADKGLLQAFSTHKSSFLWKEKHQPGEYGTLPHAKGVFLRITCPSGSMTLFWETFSWFKMCVMWRPKLEKKRKEKKEGPKPRGKNTKQNDHAHSYTYTRSRSSKTEGVSQHPFGPRAPPPPFLPPPRAPSQ